jgi:Zn-dependent protease
VGFVASAEQAAPLLAHLGVPPPQQPVPEVVEESATPARPLLWPKVSPLAIWALLCSALVFVPYVGLLPAVATVVLLILHRRRVRPTAAFGHSRTLCATAFVFLILGSVVSALAIGGLREHAQGFDSDSLLSSPIAKDRNWGIIGCGIFVVLLSLTVHEAAHAITAWWLGDGLARSLGRVTLNPMAHIDPFGTILLPILLITAGAPAFGYAKPVPVQVEMLPRYRRAHILISIAGPGSNLLLACLSLLLLLGLTCGLRLAVPEASLTNLASLNPEAPLVATGFALSAVFGPLCMILKLGFVINVALALFNLIPIPPLDGSWVLEHLFPNSLGRLYSVLRPYAFLVFIGAVYAGAFEYMTYPFVLMVGPGLMLVAAATGM